MNKLTQILKKSKFVDAKFDSITREKLLSYKIKFIVPSFHSRAKLISSYQLKIGKINDIKKSISLRNSKKNTIWVIDKNVSNLSFLAAILPENKNKERIIHVEAEEDKLKEFRYIQEFIEKNKIKKENTPVVLIGVGGGLILNVVSYIAEYLEADLILIPTTIMAMADGSGGKVRLNFVDEKRMIKHYYKSYYEPNLILLDVRFLNSLTKSLISIGLVEIIKHGLFQSRELFDYLNSSKFSPFTEKKSLIKAILWAAELKSICLEIDVEENADGSRGILRGGHEFSDRIEEDLKFTIPHGFAVAIGICKQLEVSRNKLLSKAVKLFSKYNIPTTIEGWKKFYRGKYK